MTEASDLGNYLVRVRAQVMTRDDSSGGWVPLSGGGLANVSVRRRVHSSNNQSSTSNSNGDSTTSLASSEPSSINSINNGSQDHGSSNTSPPGAPKEKHEYLIYGKRITDQSVVLSCIIKKDFEYNKVMPTFHHWRTGEKKFGLTFQTAADARAFDKGVRTAVEELLEDGGDEDDVFMTLNLPAEPPELRQDAQISGVVRVTNYNSSPQSLPEHYLSGGKMPPPLPHEPTADIASDNYPYVQLTSLNHEYLYPVIDEQQHHQHHKPTDRLDRTNSTGSLKKPDILVSKPTKQALAATTTTTMSFASGKEATRSVVSGSGNARYRCRHCQELYSESNNPRGACEYAPDPVKNGIATVSCLSCAQCMLYHCMSDAEGDFNQSPCSCIAEEDCGKRWLGMSLLSLVVPCLCFYPPLRAIHWCSTSCGLCGGRHHPME
ncbi:sprouty-related, EVH1 domain-containing protein 1 isoform X2 [Phymastichus coffea]|uniref:sprouty-related, EVH1 domain-containing protein 1 isoform X2 n=1 Tax=Phymastichus coffea TaxID=108790 RepID=UPI00273BF9FB|nr:sprouty-related, EVH1 domain-containing protein 1 isoform X2 [Phymastichus coffea]